MPAFSAKTIRHVALLLILGLASVFVNTLFVSGQKASANSYVYQGLGGSRTNDPWIEFRYIWATNEDRVSIGIEGPLNLQATWTRESDSQSITVQIPNATVSPTASQIVNIQTPPNSWSAGVVVSLKIEPRPGATPFGLTGINNTNNYNSNRKLFEVVSLGSSFTPYTRLVQAFTGASSSTKISAQLPTTVRDLTWAFRNTDFNGDLSGWDTSQITNMSKLFYNDTGNSKFNKPIGSWTVSNVTNMSEMFRGASSFNQSLENWNVSNVTNMSYMFSGASVFNQPLNSWSTSNVTNMSYMFSGASVFNQPLNSWSTSNVTNMSFMFNGASAFNQRLEAWDVRKVTSIQSMFGSATSFNNGDQTISASVAGTFPLSWNTPSLSNLSSAFYNASKFNQNLNSWSTSLVTNMSDLFNLATNFNNGDSTTAFDGDGTSQVKMTWDVSNVTDMTRTFQDAANFNQDLNSWTTSKLQSMNWTFERATKFNNGDPETAFAGDASASDVVMSWATPLLNSLAGAFRDAKAFNQALNGWDTSGVTNMSGLFTRATNFNNGDSGAAFNGDSSGTDVRFIWTTSEVTFLSAAFEGATKFNQDLNSWDTRKVTQIDSTFLNATMFNNGDPSNAFVGDSRGSAVRFTWTTSALTNMRQAFQGAQSFNQDLNGWSVSKVTNMTRAFMGAARFNNGDPEWAYEGDLSSSQVAMPWVLSALVNTTTTDGLYQTFGGASAFNQNISTWNPVQLSRLNCLFGSGPNSFTCNTFTPVNFNNGAATWSSNVLAWSTSSVVSLENAFRGLPFFNSDLSTWSTSNVTSMVSAFESTGRFNRPLSTWSTAKVTSFTGMFKNAQSFNQPIGDWDIRAGENFQDMFNGALAFNQDLGKWGPFRSNANLSNLWTSGAPGFNDSPKNWIVSSVLPGSFQRMFGTELAPATTATMSMPSNVIKSILLNWSFQNHTTTSRSIGNFRVPIFSNCQDWSFYKRLAEVNFTFTGGGNYVAPSVSAPASCVSVSVSWNPSPSIPLSYGVVFPDTAATTTGVSGVRYVVRDRGTSMCTVNETSGAISHGSSGSCVIVAYDAGLQSNTADPSGYKIATFNLPTPTAMPTPSAPAITTASAAAGAIGLTFDAPSTSGTAPLGGYEVGYSLTSGGATTWVTVSPVVTSSSTLNYTLSGLVNGTSYWVKVRAFNSNGSGLESQEVGPLTPATTPSSPSITNFVRSNTQIQFSISAPSTDGGSRVTRYEYRFATTAVGVDGQSWQVAASTNSPVVLTGLTNGQNYFFQVRAVNAIGASSPSATSAGVTPMTTASAPVIVASTKAGTGTTATIEFLAPSSNGGSAISAYEVRSSTDEGQTWGNWAVSSTSFDVNSGRTSIFLSGLNGSAQNPVYYTFEVRAQNEAGYSARSLQAPSGAEISNVVFGNQNATVSFKAAQYDGNSSILGYEYMLRTGPSSNPTSIGPWVSISSAVWQQATTTATASFNITGLTNGINYTVWVRAVNAIGGQTAAYQNWFNNSGVPNKPLPTLAFSYGVTAQSYSPTASYSPVVTTDSDGNISYTTSTPVLCNVNTTSGLVSNLRPGTCEIRVSITEGSSHQSRSATASIRTDPAGQPPLVITPSSTSAPFLGPITLTYSGGAGIGGIIVQLGVGSTCVTDGVLVTLGPVGTSCVIVATKNGDGNYLAGPSTQISLTSTKAQQAAITISNRAQMTAGTSMTLAASGGSGNGLFSFVVANAGSTGCSIAGGVLSAQTSGNCVIQASRATSNNYLQSATASLTISVVKASQNLRFTSNVPNDPQAGGSYTPAVTVSSGLTPVLSVSGACTIANGVVSFTVSGDCTIEASQSGDGTYLAAPAASQTISVGRRNQTLSFVSTSQAVQYKTFGDPAFLIQATSSEVAANISYTLSPATTNQACSVFSSGLVVVQRVGDCVVLAYSPQTAAVAAASTISKFIEIRPDFASAPFITSVARGNLSIDVGFAAPSYIGGSSMSAYSLVAIDQSLLPTPDVTSTACFHDVGNQISCRISGLENGRTYKVKVAAINGAGVGEYSILSPAVLVATNPAAVQNVRVVQGAATLQISWDDPESLGGGTFSSYRVFIKRSSAASYNSSHYFNVTSQSTRSITVSAEAPPDGMGFLGGPALVNGVAYDIKIVTVTTANTEELTGNTAVVNQIPRTVPEPPRLASSLVVGNKLVLTWTAPLSDGGSPVTSYSASVGSNPCVFAQASDTFCEIALPTAPGNYTYSIAAENVAGASTPIQGVFTVVSLNSSGGSSGGSTGGSSGGSIGGGSVNPSNPGGVIIEPGKPSESAPIVSGVSYGADKKQIVVRGTALRGVAKVFVGTTRAEVIGQSTEMIILRTPDLKYGIYPIYIHFADGNVLRVKNQLIVGKPLTQALNKTVRITGFAPGSSRLTNAMQRQLTAVFRANRGSSALVCVGHTQGPTILNSDARLAMRRAAAVCSLARQQGIKTVSASYQNNPQVGPGFRRVDLVFTR